MTRIGGSGWTENDELTDDPFKLAVVVTVPDALAEETFTVKAAVVCPEATVTDDGMLKVMPVAAAPRETAVPDVGAALVRAMVQESEAGAVIEAGEQDIDLIMTTV